jgi:hypothetical protein
MQIKLGRWAIAAAFLIVLVPPAAVAANGADADAQDDRADRLTDQSDAVDAAILDEQQRATANSTTPPAQKPFNIRIMAPLNYNSNAQEIHSGGSAALEGDPELELGWSRRLTSVPLVLSIRFRSDTDRYANVPQADEDEMSTTFKVQYYNPADDQALAPFVSYKNTLMFDATFSPWTQTKNDFSVGLTKAFYFDSRLHPLPVSARSGADADWGLVVSTSAQRRLRTPGSDSTALTATAAVSYVPTDTLDISLGVTLKQRWFDPAATKTAIVARRDFTAEPLLTLMWDASALAAGLPQVGFQIDFEHKASNIAVKSYNQWAVGPMISAGWKF